MARFDESPKTVLRRHLMHRRSKTSLLFSGTIEMVKEERWLVTYSHVPQPTESSAFWYSDSLTGAESFDEALELFDTMCGEIEDAWEVGPWRD